MRVKAKRKEKKRKAIHDLIMDLIMDRNGMELNVGKKRESME